MWSSIQRELGEVLDALTSRGVAGAEKLREEARELFGNVHKTNERTAVHNAHVIISDVLRHSVNEVPGFANHLFGTETAGKVRIVEHCVSSGPSAHVRLEANVGTHDVLVSITRLPKDGEKRPVSLDTVERAMGSVDDRREACGNAMRTAAAIGLADELGGSLNADMEMYEVVSECLLFLRELLATENARTE